MVLPSNRPSLIWVNFLPLHLPGVVPQTTERLPTQERIGPTKHRAMVRKTQQQSERREIAATECLVDGPVPTTWKSFLIWRPGCPRFPSPIATLGVLLTHHIAPPPPHVQAFPAGTVLEDWGPTPRPQLPFRITTTDPRRFPPLDFWVAPQTPPTHHFAASEWVAGGTDVLDSRRRNERDDGGASGPATVSALRPRTPPLYGISQALTCRNPGQFPSPPPSSLCRRLARLQGNGELVLRRGQRPEQKGFLHTSALGHVTATSSTNSGPQFPLPPAVRQKRTRPHYIPSPIPGLVTVSLLIPSLRSRVCLPFSDYQKGTASFPGATGHLHFFEKLPLPSLGSWDSNLSFHLLSSQLLMSTISSEIQSEIWKGDLKCECGFYFLNILFCSFCSALSCSQPEGEKIL